MIESERGAPQKTVKVFQHIFFFYFFSVRQGPDCQRVNMNMSLVHIWIYWEEWQSMKGLENFLRLSGSEKVFCNEKLYKIKIQIFQKKKSFKGTG